ncbi:MAG TPA: SRPBCC family protein [Bacteroidia bacterium]|jgi:ligand-binding SRPBCC domain-containing protein|nr:SRPBCC family protein [Bacteroidia bacterium]
MPKIEITTPINAPIERCFLFSLSIDLHCLSTKETNEKAIAGVTSGVMKLNDTVTWRAKHLGIYQNLTSKITKYEYPTYFVDEQVKGIFKKIYHEHLFEQHENRTTMKDIFEFEAPYGTLGIIFSKLVLTSYMKRFLEKRNETIKEVAESETWRKILVN